MNWNRLSLNHSPPSCSLYGPSILKKTRGSSRAGSPDDSFSRGTFVPVPMGSPPFPGSMPLASFGEFSRSSTPAHGLSPIKASRRGAVTRLIHLLRLFLHFWINRLLFFADGAETSRAQSRDSNDLPQQCAQIGNERSHFESTRGA